MTAVDKYGAVEVMVLLLRGYKNVISGFQCVTTATKQRIRCLKEFYVVVKRLQYRNAESALFRDISPFVS